MALSKKHFERIAGDIARRVDFIKNNTQLIDDERETAVTAISIVVNDLANFFVEESERFDRQRFLKACGF